MNWSKTIENLSLGFTIVMVIIPLFKDVIYREKQSKWFIKKITWGGWLLIVLGGLIVGLNFKKQNIDEVSKETDQSDLINKLTNHFDSSLKEYNLIYNKKTGKIDYFLSLNTQKNTQSGAIKEEEEPLLDISVPPFFQRKTNEDSVNVDFTIKNYSNSPAVNVNTVIYKILKTNRKFFLIGKVPNGSRQFITIEPKESYSFYLNFHLKPISLDSVFYFIKIKYTNETGTIKKTVRSIYLIPYPSSSTVIFDVSENDFTSIKRFLQSTRFWE